ncbi:hypothetical protein TRVA0_056S00672 [Trichomonascus vanleenenianus]|uniref:Sps4p n=1 Tax=Trichomonascus vanleenenianus TaxID=2268995 RepID=UPI003ECB966B
MPTQLEEVIVDPEAPVEEYGDQRDNLPQSLFVQHMASYPAIAAVVGFAASFPVVKIFASNAVPLFMAARKRSKPVSDPIARRAKPVLVRADKFGDQALNTVDRTFPRLKTAQPEEVLEMARVPIRNVRSSASAAHRTLDRGIVRPAKQATSVARARYARVYDTNGKALLRSRLDPIVMPLNDRLEGFIVDYVSDGNDIEKKPVSNELSRTVRLGRVALHRARPALRAHVVYLSDLPQAARDAVLGRRKTTNEEEEQNGSASPAAGVVNDSTTE